MMHRLALFRIVGPALALACGGPLLAQGASGGRVFVDADPTGRMVAVALSFPTGHAHDPQGGEGTAFLLGEVVTAEGNLRLTRHNAQVEVRVEPSRFLVTLLAPPERWAAAMGELRGLLSSSPLPESEVTRARIRVENRLLFESGAPIRIFEREKAAFLFGAGDPAARPREGTRASVIPLDAAALMRFREDRLQIDNATIAVTGPVTPTSVEQVFGTPVIPVLRRRAAIRPAPASGTRAVADTMPLPPAPELRIGGMMSPALRVPEPPAGPPAWSEGDRRILNQELTSSWIGISYPMPRGSPEILMQFLAHLVTEAMNPVPPGPGIYTAEAKVQEVRGAPVLVVTATVDPRVTSRWEARILDTLEELAVSPPDGAFFELTRRRFRSGHLLALDSPEAVARWLADNTRNDGSVPEREHELWRLDQQGVRDLASALGPPRILIYGPVSMMTP